MRFIGSLVLVAAVGGAAWWLLGRGPEPEYAPSEPAVLRAPAPVASPDALTVQATPSAPLPWGDGEHAPMDEAGLAHVQLSVPIAHGRVTGKALLEAIEGTVTLHWMNPRDRAGLEALQFDDWPEAPPEGLHLLDVVQRIRDRGYGVQFRRGALLVRAHPR